MATRRTTSHTSETSELIGFCSFWGLVFAGVTGLVSFMFWLLLKCGVEIHWAGTVIGICSLLSSLGVLIGIALAAWRYARYKSKGYRILYFVAIVLYILGCFGVI